MFHSSLVIWSSVDYQTAYGLRIGAVTPPNQYCEAFSASGKAVPRPLAGPFECRRRRVLASA
jgi:hypothetical protein